MVETVDGAEFGAVSPSGPPQPVDTSTASTANTDPIRFGTKQPPLRIGLPALDTTWQFPMYTRKLALHTRSFGGPVSVSHVHMGNRRATAEDRLLGHRKSPDPAGSRCTRRVSRCC